MMIDNGSCNNVANSTLIIKLNMINHISFSGWLNIKKLGVTKHVLISFTIKKFKYEVVCDVVPMYVTHLLLEG